MLNVILNPLKTNLSVTLSKQSTFDIFSVLLTEHCVELLRVKVPLPPGSLVTLGLGVVGMVELWFCPKRVQHSQHAPSMLNKDKNINACSTPET